MTCWWRLGRCRRDLPARVGVYFVLALALFGDRSYTGVWHSLVAGLQGLPGLALACPSGQGLGLARGRVGAAPVKALFEVLAGPLGRPATPGVRYRRWRTVAFDGCSSIKAADQGPVRSWLGCPRRWLGLPGYPTVMLVALIETGTWGLLAAVFGSSIGSGNGEISYAQRLCHRLDASMLLLGDRAYDANDFLRRVAKTAHRRRARPRRPCRARHRPGARSGRLTGLPRYP
jgi:hypothetical protein